MQAHHIAIEAEVKHENVPLNVWGNCQRFSTCRMTDLLLLILS